MCTSAKNHAVNIAMLGSSSLDSRPLWPREGLVKTLTGSASSAGMTATGVEERHISQPAFEFYQWQEVQKLEYYMYLTNCVEDLKTQFVGFKNCGIPARHFRA